MFANRLLILAGAALVLGFCQPDARAQDPQPRRGAKASLGVFVEPPSGESEFNGVVVRDVAPDGPAAKAGIQSGDRIVKVGDKEVKRFNELLDILNQHTPGDKLSVQIKRDNEDKTLTVTLGQPTSQRGAPGVPGERPSGPQLRPPQTPGFPGQARGAFLGVRTEELNPDTKQSSGVSVDKGVVIADVLPDTPAAKAGLKSGDVVTSFDGKPVSTPAELRNTVQAAGTGKEVTVKFARGKETKEVKVELTENRGDESGRPDPFEVRIPSARNFEGRLDRLEKRISELERRLKEISPSGTKKDGGS
jgi:S1-C subfamily serine protease